MAMEAAMEVAVTGVAIDVHPPATTAVSLTRASRRHRVGILHWVTRA